MRSVPSRHPTPGWGADMHRDHLESVIFGLPNPQLSEVVHERYARLYLESFSRFDVERYLHHWLCWQLIVFGKDSLA
jgi:hypothetical protein